MIKYTAGSNKGQTKQGDVFNTPFALGKVDPDYTSERVVEPITGTHSTGTYTPAWSPVVKGTFTDREGNVKDVKVLKKGEQTPYFGTINDQGKVVVDGGLKDGDRVCYVYDNAIIPQNDLPILNAEMANISLFAKPRRIAIYYSQIAAFQAKTDYGFDLGDQLAEKAVGQLQYRQNCTLVA